MMLLCAAVQLQTQASTIQGHVERALSTVLREDRRVLGVSAAGRTDAGVHARGQVGCRRCVSVRLKAKAS